MTFGKIFPQATVGAGVLTPPRPGPESLRLKPWLLTISLDNPPVIFDIAVGRTYT